MNETFKAILTVFLSLLLLLAGSSLLFAEPEASFGFLYLPGVQGDADDPAHRNWIEVLSCDWGSVPPPRGTMVPESGKGAAGKLCFGDFSFLKYVDATSEILAGYCDRSVQLSHIRVELAGSSMGKFKYLILRKVKVLSVRPGKTESDGSKTEVVTVGFRQVEYQ